MNTKILILDDFQIRHDAIKPFLEERRKENQELEFFSAFTCREAFSLLNKHDFDILCLDHDLADADPGKADRDGAMSGYAGGSQFLTGADFCHVLAHKSKSDPKLRDVQVWIHSWNQAGAKSMNNILQTNGFTNVTVAQAPGGKIV